MSIKKSHQKRKESLVNRDKVFGAIRVTKSGEGNGRSTSMAMQGKSKRLIWDADGKPVSKEFNDKDLGFDPIAVRKAFDKGPRIVTHYSSNGDFSILKDLGSTFSIDIYGSENATLGPKETIGLSGRKTAMAEKRTEYSSPVWSKNSIHVQAALR